MARIVMKFGGTSVGSLERIQAVADRITRSIKQGNQVIAVCSAMSGETNRLVDLAHQLSVRPTPRELDVLLHTGELVSIALMSIALNERGVPASSFTGLQARIRTDAAHTKARIQEIEPQPLIDAIEDGGVAVVAGFQGVGPEGQTTTLGRGGSDLSAVALAYATNADVCEIYTDVDGIYTCDPNMVPEARKIERISYEEMLELASLGAKVLQSRSVEFAMKYNVPLHVRSSFVEDTGTWVGEEIEEMEDILVSGIATTNKEAKVTIRGVPDQPGIAANVFTPLAEANINVDMIIQNVSTEGLTDLTFSVPQDDLDRASEILEGLKGSIGWKEFETDANVSKVSAVGVGMRSHAGVAAKMFKTLSDNGINIESIGTSEIKISVLIDKKYTELAARELHKAFGLDQPPERRES